MLIIKKIKTWFKWEHEKKDENILSIHELEHWFNKNIAQVKKIIAEKSDEICPRLSALLHQLEEEIKKLEQVNINEKKEYEQVKQITALGRRDYILELRKLIRQLKEKKDIPYINQEIDQFAQFSAKSRSKATYLIGKEVEDITFTLIKIRSLENDFLKNNEELIEKYNTLKIAYTKSIERDSAPERKKHIQTQIGNIEQLIKEKEKRAVDLLHNIQKISESDEAIEKEALLHQKKSTEESLQALALEIKSLIDKRLLEKYLYLEQDKSHVRFIQSYIENPVHALISDEDLFIIQLLEKIKEKIKRNEIKLKDPHKILEKLRVNKETLLHKKNKVISMDEKIKTLDKQINNLSLDITPLENEMSCIKKEIGEDKKLLEKLLRKEEKMEHEIQQITLELAAELKKHGVHLLF